MPLNPWSHDDFDDEDDLSDRLEAAMRELEELKYLFPTTETFTHLVASDPVLGDFALTKGHRRPDKHSCLRYWQILVLDGPTASTAYHMRSCDFCRSTMKDVLDHEEQPSLKLLYDRLWTMPLDPTDEEVEQMEALTELKNALREIEEEDIAARVAERQGTTVGRRERATETRRESVATGATRIGTNRRRFLSATIALALTAAGAVGHGVWSSIASVQKPQALATPNTQNYYRYLEAVLASGGVNAIQATYSGATRSEAIKCIRWVRERKVIPAYGFLVSCMSDPRIEIRALAAYEALKVNPRDLKVHIGLLQATLASETDVEQQTVLTTLIANVQNA